MVDRHFLHGNLDAVRTRISGAAQKAGCDPATIRLVVVTKGHSAESIQALYELGVREIGESYVEEGLEKQARLGSITDLAWHMIGHVQSRKAETVAKYFTMVHSVDRLKLARRLDRSAAESDRALQILLECNVSGEATKYGWHAWDKEGWPSLIPEIGEVLTLPNVRVHGLMSMAPYLDDAEKARLYFARTRELRDFLGQNFPQSDWSQLSMGMSGDFEAAILEGATILRIGTAILGPRPT